MPHAPQQEVRVMIGTVLKTASVAIVLAMGLATVSDARAGEEEAKALLKAMSDYLGAQKAISFAFDTNLEIVTKDHQKLLLASSGTIELGRPDKLRATRFGGFANVEMIFDGKTLTVFGKDANLYTQSDVPGTVDHLVEEMRDKLGRPVPGADLLLPDAYDKLMEDVTDVKDLGSGVIGGVECDHLAFRAKEVDWQIWIAQGDQPRPCRYVITASKVDQGPQYSIQISDWKTGVDVGAEDYTFANTTNAKKVDLKDLKDIDELPDHLAMGDRK
ncbi:MULTISPECIES: DUF2092 domain-containing protein [unclassified Rhizobium]|uniref:DUF2092 domain-containing protein n=1 Tax=unclassified Rhizobium TaxID=2613769 RepID=UPI0006F41FE3|nr:MULTISPECIES: DUF2092 domain-containing protein [unclassified Rhizobium]KQV41737.1 hypothetical protein ASC86_20175 [Rhizobium sp. Root1212]KRD32253.1 hypothetical protein ASE37_22815 [Rhizobium sp. Root268]